MKNLFKLTMTSVLAIAMMASSADMSAQARRSGTTSSTSSSSTSSSSSSTAQGSSSSSTSATRVTRSTTNRNNNTSGTSTSATTATRNAQVNRSSGSASSSSSTSTATQTPQVNRGSSSSTSSSSNQNSTTVRRGSTTSGSTSSSRSSGSTSTSSKSSTSSSSSTTQRQATTAARQSGTVTGSGTSVSGSSSNRAVTPARASSGTAKTSGTSAASSQDGNQTSARSGEVTRRNMSVTTKGLGNANSQSQSQPNDRQPNFNGPQNAPSNIAGNQVNHMRMDDNRNMQRIPPRDRGHMMYDAPGHFYDRGPHYFGYRVESLPPARKHMTFWGRDYYYYNDIYYRRYGTYYAVSRPPFGITFKVSLRDRGFATVRFAYYHNVYRTYNTVDKNIKTIIKQNEQIARNNAILAQQNSMLALNSSRALSAYELAEALGLVQVYAGLDTDYYYEDGVFYVINKKGYYEVIAPPAGALVDQLPDDYDIIVFNGIEYYVVDDTVYRLVLEDGSPYLEVLGQMPASVYKTYFK